MVQGSIKLKGPANSRAVKSKVNANARKLENKSKLVRKGNPVQLPKSNFRNEALDDRAVSKAICKKGEQKMAGKLIQAGGKLTTSDLHQKGKELNRDNRRNIVKKKLSRVEEKLNILKTKAENHS